MAVDPDHFRHGMRRLGAGVTILTTLWQGERRGLTATAVCSVSVSPPTLLACVNRASTSWEAIRAARILAVNLLTTDQIALAERFGGAEGLGPRFDEGSWQTLMTGAPVLDGALASFDCRVVEQIEAGSHTVFLAEVEAVRLGAGEPLLYLAGQFCMAGPLGTPF